MKLKRPRYSSPNINKHIVIASEIILNLPSLEEAMWIPLEEAIALNPVTANSLPNIMTTIQAETAPNSTRQMKAEAISSLSAIGSNICPNIVTCPLFLAKSPSRVSVRAARRKMMAAASSFPSN